MPARPCEKGHDDVLKWAHKRGFPMDERVLLFGSKHPEIVEYARKNGALVPGHDLSKQLLISPGA